jgi:uncharacterized protein Usg
MSVFDQEMKNSFKSGEFTLRRRLGLLDLAKFFDGWLSYGGYGVARNGKYAVKQGGRDLEAMHIHYFLDTHGKTVVQYKYCERDGVPYLPTRHGFLSFFFDSHAQVFTDGALDALSALHKVDGDGGIRPCLAPLKP